MTLQLLWEEYQRGSELAYKYTSFCIKYRIWAEALMPTKGPTASSGARSEVR